MEGGTIDPNTLTIRLVQEVTIPLKPLIFKWNHSNQRSDDEILLPVYLNKTRKNLVFSIRVKMGKVSRYTLYQKGLALILFN